MLFRSDGGVVGRVQSAEDVRTIRAEPDALFRGWPMVVLSDGATNPGVAWLCEALRDNHRATILGNSYASGDPLVQEMVALPGGEWSVQMATGRLERGDGRPLAALDPNPRRGVVRKMDEGNPADPAGQDPYLAPPSFRDPRSARSANPTNGPDPLAKAREVLAEALKSAHE